MLRYFVHLEAISSNINGLFCSNIIAKAAIV